MVNKFFNMEYVNNPEFYGTDLYSSIQQRPTDIQLPKVMNLVLLATWGAVCLLGFAVILIAKMPVAGIVIIAVPTFIGMVIKPTFALSLMMMVLTAGGGVGVQGTFALSRGVGIAFAVSFALNILISRPALHIRSKALWVIVVYTIWMFFVTLASPYLALEIRDSFSTQVQLLILVLIIYWILNSNGETALRWALRSFVVGSLGSITITFMTGAAMGNVQQGQEVGGRYRATLGSNVIDANMMAVLVGLAFFAAVYLFVRDKSKFWRLIYGAGILFLPIMMLKIGSRGGLIAFAFTLMSPLLFIRQVVRKPILAIFYLYVKTFVQKHFKSPSSFQTIHHS